MGSHGETLGITKEVKKGVKLKLFVFLHLVLVIMQRERRYWRRKNMFLLVMSCGKSSGRSEWEKLRRNINSAIAAPLQAMTG